MALSHYFTSQKIKKKPNETASVNPIDLLGQTSNLPKPRNEMSQSAQVPSHPPCAHHELSDLFSGISSPSEGVCWRTWDLSYFCPFCGAKNPSKRDFPGNPSLFFLHIDYVSGLQLWAIFSGVLHKVFVLPGFLG